MGGEAGLELDLERELALMAVKADGVWKESKKGKSGRVLYRGDASVVEGLGGGDDVVRLGTVKTMVMLASSGASYIGDGENRLSLDVRPCPEDR